MPLDISFLWYKIDVLMKSTLLIEISSRILIKNFPHFLFLQKMLQCNSIIAKINIATVSMLLNSVIFT